MKEKVNFEGFEKLDLRVGRILDVEDHPNADKLYILKVDFHAEKRTIVAGLRKFYKKDELKGKKAVFVFNLEPASLRGVESNGMILAAVNEDRSKAVILSLDKDIEEGTKIS